MEVLKIAVAGTGRRAQAHLSTIVKMTDLYRLVGVCDVDRKKAEEAAGRYGGKAYDHPVRMMEGERPDLLFVIVPPEGHHVLAEAAADRDIHVMSETPIGITLPCIDRMIEAARRNRVKLEVSENVWRFPAERLKRRIVDAGLLGPVTQVHCQYLSGAYHGMNAIRLYAGGEARRVVGVARDVPVRPYVSYGDIPVKANTWEAGLIEFDNGVTVVYEFPARRAGSRGNYWEVDGPEGHILGNDLFLYRKGEKGDERAQYPILTDVEEAGGKKVITRLRVETDPPVVWENPYARYETTGADDVARADQLAMMHRAIVKDVEPGYGAAQGRKDQELVIAVRASALMGGMPVDLPLKGVTAHEERLHAEFRERFGCDPLSPTGQAIEMFYPTIGVRQAVKK